MLSLVSKRRDQRGAAQMESTITTSTNGNSWEIVPTHTLAGIVLGVLFIYLFFRHFMFVLMFMDLILGWLRKFNWFPKEAVALPLEVFRPSSKAQEDFNPLDHRVGTVPWVLVCGWFFWLAGIHSSIAVIHACRSIMQVGLKAVMRRCGAPHDRHGGAARRSRPRAVVRRKGGTYPLLPFATFCRMIRRATK